MCCPLFPIKTSRSSRSPSLVELACSSRILLSGLLLISAQIAAETSNRGDQCVPDKLMPLVYDELRRLAHQYMRREKPGQTLSIASATTHVIQTCYEE